MIKDAAARLKSKALIARGAGNDMAADDIEALLKHINDLQSLVVRAGKMLPEYQRSWHRHAANLIEKTENTK